jgi:5-methylthioadenosine/S-adenosylhomocysteine deaminase
MLMNLLLYDAAIVTCRKRIIREGALVIEKGEIIDVGKSAGIRRKYGRGYEKLDAKGKVVIPGLINTHQHAAMSLLRGYADDLPLLEWLERWIWPVEKHMTASDIYVGALLTAVESIMGGTTTVNTMYHYTPGQNEAKAFADAGLRGVIGHVCFSWRKGEDKNAIENLAKNWHNKADGLIRTSVDPHSPYTVDPEYMKELRAARKELNEKYGSRRAPIICHTHAAETSDEPQKIQRAFGIPLKGGVMEYLDSLGVLDEHVVAAHCVALTAKDVTVMKRRSVKVSHNPISNLKLASGISPVTQMLGKGVTVSLGTDSPCSNNTADMFELMKTTAILHKGINKNPTLLPAEQILEMATIGGAEALSWEREIGSIETGKKADLAIISFKKPHLCPLYRETSHLVYAAKAADVETVIINGKIVMENRELTKVNRERIMEAAEKAKSHLADRLVAEAK